MSHYTKVNFMKIEPSGSDERSQLRFSRKFLDSKDLGVSYLKYAPNYRNQTAHKHLEQEEVYTVIAGSGRALLDGKVEELSQWDVLRVAPETVRAFEAGPDGLEMIIAGGPKPSEGDGEKVDANWAS